MYDDHGYERHDDYGERPSNRRPPPPRQLPDQRNKRPEQKDKGSLYKGIGGLVVAIVALIFVIIIMYMGYSWYSVAYEEYAQDAPTEKDEIIIDYQIEQYSIETKFVINYQNISNISSPKKDTYQYDSEYYNSRDVGDVMDLINYFYLFTIILLIISIIMIPIGAMGKMPHGIPMVTLLLALVFSLIVPLYFFFYIPAAVETHTINYTGNTFDNETYENFRYEGDFYGSRNGYFDNDDGVRFDWETRFNPELAFWLSFVPMFIILAAIVVYSSSKQKPQSRGPPPRDRGGYEKDYDYDYDASRRSRDRDYEYRDEPPRRPPPRPPRRRPGDGQAGAGGRGYDEHYNPPVLENDYDYGPQRRRRNY